MKTLIADEDFERHAVLKGYWHGQVIDETKGETVYEASEGSHLIVKGLPVKPSTLSDENLPRLLAEKGELR
jgi:hypothetical protein